MKNNKILIGLAVLVVLTISFLVWQFFIAKAPKVLLLTDKTEYEQDGTLKIAIKNDSGENICFSSCYPYFLEKKDGEFQSYPYSVCPEPNLNEPCVDPRQSKFFQINLPLLEAGIHRLAISVCLGCKIKEIFREDQKLYSNEFNVKEIGGEE